MENTAISLIITNFNRMKFLARSIRSCLGQIIHRREIEIILVDDASDDDSKIVWSEFTDSIKIIERSKNGGVAAASNDGVKSAKGDYVMRVDADDYLSYNACNFMSSILDNNPEVSYVFCDHIRIDSNGNKLEKVSIDSKKKLYETGAGILFRKRDILEIGCYDENLRNAEDFDLLYRLDKKNKVGYHIPIPLYRYYIHGKNMTLSEDRKKFWEQVEKKHGIQCR